MTPSPDDSSRGAPFREQERVLPSEEGSGVEVLPERVRFPWVG